MLNGIDRVRIVRSNKTSSNSDFFMWSKQIYCPPNEQILNVSDPNAVNNIQNMPTLNGQCIKAKTNIFSSTFFPVSSITDCKKKYINSN